MLHHLSITKFQPITFVKHVTIFGQKGGFRQPPTDYYPRPLFIAAADEIGHTHSDNCMLCLGPRSQVSYLFNYAQTFASRFALQRYFGFVWATSLTHDGLNMAALADEPLSTTIDTLKSRGDLKNTVLVILSDHGVRTGSFRLLPQVVQQNIILSNAPKELVKIDPHHIIGGKLFKTPAEVQKNAKAL
jgi:Protein of unknown function (DUF229)